MQTLTPRERSRIVSLLDCFRFAKSSVIHLHNTNRYVSSFISAAKDALVLSLKKLNITLQTEQNGEHNNLSLLDDTEQRLMSIHELATLASSLLDTLQKDVFDFSELNISSIQTGIRALQDLNQKTNVLDAEKLSKIRIEEIQIDPNDENFEFNIEHQWNYIASGIGLVVYPNANHFTDAHAEFWFQVSKQKRRLFRDYEFRAYLVPMHELFHCFHGHKWSFKDPPFTLWVAEFEASFAQLDLLYYAAQLDMKNNPDSIYQNGLVEECILWLYNLVTDIHHRIDDKSILEGYEAWVISHAREDPVSISADHVFDLHKDYNSYLKCRLPLEMYDEGKWLESFLTYHWNQKEKSGYDVGETVPKELMNRRPLKFE